MLYRACVLVTRDLVAGRDQPPARLLQVKMFFIRKLNESVGASDQRRQSADGCPVG